MCTGAAWQSRTPDGDDDHPAHAGAGLSLRECGRAVPARSAHPTRRPMLLRSGPEEEAVMPTPLTSSRERRASGDANPPYVFELGPDQGRRTFDAVQSGPLKKLPVYIEDTIGALLRPPGGHSSPRTTSGSRASQRRRCRSGRLPCQLVTAEPRARCCDSLGVRSSAFGSTASDRERAIALSRSRGRLHTPRRSAGHDRHGRARGSAPVRPCRPGSGAWLRDGWSTGSSLGRGCHGLHPLGIVGAAHRVGLQGVEGALPRPGRCARREVTARLRGRASGSWPASAAGGSGDVG
jgi:hypothetical protein